MSLVKPPDPELLKTMSVKDQRDLMASHAAVCLRQTSSPGSSLAGSRPGSRPGSKPGSRSASTSSSRRASLAADGDDDARSEDGEVRSILKAEDRADSEAKQPQLHGILKPATPSADASPTSTTRDTPTSGTASPAPRGILRKPKAVAPETAASDNCDVCVPQPEEPTKSILKHNEAEIQQSQNEDNMHGILKMIDSNEKDARSNGEDSMHGILKLDDVTKTSTTTDDDGWTVTTDVIEVPVGILKQVSVEASNSADAYSQLGSTHASCTGLSLSGVCSSESADSETPKSADSSSAASVHQSSPPGITLDGATSLGEVVSKGDTRKDGNLPGSGAASQDIDPVCAGSSHQSPEERRRQHGQDPDAGTQASLQVPPGDEGSRSGTSEGESSSGELLEDGGRRRRRRRSRFNSQGSKDDERYKTQPPGQVALVAAASEPQAPRGPLRQYEGRHRTQPVTHGEMREAEAAQPRPVGPSPATPGGSISDRLNALKTSGEEDWRRRVKKDLKAGEEEKEKGHLAERLSALKTSGEEDWRRRVKKEVVGPGAEEAVISSGENSPLPDAVVRLREKSGTPAKRPNSIADRLSELSNSQRTWKGRVEESDAKTFTVAHRLSSSSFSGGESPLLKQRAKVGTRDGQSFSGGESPLLKPRPKLGAKKDELSESRDATPKSSPSTPTKEFVPKIRIPKEILSDLVVDKEEEAAMKSSKPATRGGIIIKRGVAGEENEEEEKKEPVKVAVPVIGEEIDSFFSSKTIDQMKDKVELTTDDFDDIFCEAGDILPTVRKVRPARKARPSSLNPLKAMSKTVDIQHEYTEVSKGTAEKELKRIKKEKMSKEAGFAQEALAGLASKENFKKVELRRSDSGVGQRHDPFTEVMLLHVKGRRMVQTRLVEPHTRSLNAGDCYVLVTPDKCIVWEGQYCNVIEKAKAADIASFIIQKKDMGCKKATEAANITQVMGLRGSGTPGARTAFYKALEGERQCQDGGPEAEDEQFEGRAVRANMVYRLVGQALEPYEEYWGMAPKYEMMKKNEVLVFDFGTEFYLWQGKAVTMEQRKLGLRLAKKLHDKGYDYTHAAINPFSPGRSEEDGGLPSKAAVRPKWTIFGKINQNMETILFREKFADWPDSSRIIGCKGQDATKEATSKDVVELKAYDAARMIPPSPLPVTMKLDGEHVGRGTRWTEDMQGFTKEKDIVTRDVAVWHVLEYDHARLPPASYGQIHDGDTYVVRWQYMVSNANLKTLKGTAARNSLSGRERCAYFFWQGNHSTVNEKGASALMTVELDEERGPQVRVLEGKEYPCFLNLFGGSMVVHRGKREEPETCTQGAWRLYCLRGDYSNEVYLLEIPVSLEHLRSRSSLLLLNVNTGVTFVWHGSKSPSHVKANCLNSAERLKKDRPEEVGLHKDASIIITELEEGNEKSAFWSALDGRDRSVYHSLLEDPELYDSTMRMYHMSSVNMSFEVHEQLNPTRCPDLVTPFPFLQSDLYKATQPSLFLVDCGPCVYLWQGWWPKGSHEHDNVHTGSATARFNADRRCAMETTLHYCREKNSSNPPKAYVVCAGMEPKCFTTLFPYWIVDQIVQDLAIEEGREEGYMEPVAAVLRRLTQTRYSMEELLVRPLPEGVDPLRLEAFLHEAEFERVLQMSRDEFYGQPPWKQKQLKQNLGLF